MARILKSIVFEPDQTVALSGTTPILGAEAPAESVEAAMASPASTPDLDPVTTRLADTQAQVEVMLQQAQAEIATWQEQARREGWQAGYNEAREEAEAKLAEALKVARDIAQAAVTAHENFLRDSQAELGRLAVAVARKIIDKELTVNPKVITDIVAQAIMVANIRGECRILVHPADYEIIEPHWAAIPSFQPVGCSWELLADSRVQPGGCLIEAGAGTVDAQLETKLAQVAQAFVQLEHNSGG